MFASMGISKKFLEKIDIKIRRILNSFLRSNIYRVASYVQVLETLDMGVPVMIDEYADYKVNYIANLMSTEEKKLILNGYHNLERN
jgi:hypothetical protein